LQLKKKDTGQAGIILLNGNENAYGPSTAARKAMTELQEILIAIPMTRYQC
jgi:hypothetical protein